MLLHRPSSPFRLCNLRHVLLLFIVLHPSGWILTVHLEQGRPFLTEAFVLRTQHKRDDQELLSNFIDNNHIENGGAPDERSATQPDPTTQRDLVDAVTSSGHNATTANKPWMTIFLFIRNHFFSKKDEISEGTNDAKSENAITVDDTITNILDESNIDSNHKNISNVTSQENGKSTSVLSSDTVLVRPESHGPIMAPITAYTWRSKDDWPDENYELPMYQTLNRNTDDYWNYILDELLLARVDVIMFHGRGCLELDSSDDRGIGDLCPRHLSKFIDAVQRAGVQDVIKVGMWDDTGAYNKVRNKLEDRPKGTRFDISDRSSWKYFWDHNIKIWFDTMPKQMWFLLDGKPIIAFWTLSDAFFEGQEGAASKLLEWIKLEFWKIHKVEPAFILQKNWFENDSTINTTHAVGRHNWFRPIYDDTTSAYRYDSYNNERWGTVVPSFRNGGGTTPGCKDECREVSREGGTTLINGLNAGLDAKLVLLEGWTNMAESGGFYRSLDWLYPTQYINIVRHHADPEPETLLFQAEGADQFNDSTSSNLGGEYANRSLDVGKLSDNTGWYVGWVEAGEWIEYQQVELGCGTYRFTARVASESEGKSIRLDIGNLPSTQIPFTGGMDKYQNVHLGEIKLQAGKYDMRLVIETCRGLNIDWFFLKRKQIC